MKLRALCLILLLLTTTATPAGAQGLRESVVSYHMSFDNRDFFEQDFIEISGKLSLAERKIDFPDAKFGKGIRMSFIPEPPDADNMTGIDLDLITAVMFNTRPGNTMGYNEPFIWGSGRMNPRLGAVSFWAKGAPPYACPLFEQTTIAFGRKERDLLGVLVDDDMKLSAYLRDARYVRHEIASDVVWDGSRWNHVVMNWDWASGLELWLNGELIASSEDDGWFETLLPGLFHLPTPGVTYDEVYLMDRPLSGSEISRLMKSNRPPGDEDTVYRRKDLDTALVERVSGADAASSFPAVAPGTRTVVREVWPEDASDGHVPGWYVIDGRNEMAWPHPYAFFTIIPGDADFHAEKVDIATPEESLVNYVVLTGNLTDVDVLSKPSCSGETRGLFSVPGGERFLFGSMVNAPRGGTFRIPFTESYGPPEDFEGDVVHLPRSGEKRIQEVGLYHVSTADGDAGGTAHAITFSDPGLDARYSFAVNALTARDERTLATASTTASGGRKRTVDIGGFHRLNIMADPASAETGVAALTLRLPLKTERAEEALFVRLHDPAVPSRLWNQFAVNLRGFDRGGELLLTIDCHDLALAAGDRLWLDIGTAGGCEATVGDSRNPAELIVVNAAPFTVIDAWADKEILSSKSQYSKMYEFLPWQFTGREVDLERPYCYGGPFDVILPAQAVLRLKPDHFTAQFFELMSGPDYDDGHPIHPEKHTLVTLPNPDGAPDWALYMHDFNIKRHAIADWWAERQNPDGQMGGGWNDDTLFMSFHQADLPLDGNDNARAIIDTVHTKFEATGLFRGGYCRIHPIDRMHTGDFISERYNTFVNNLGQAYAAEREMESAWHMGKPEQTPVNYAQGIAFRTSVNLFNWYWGNDVPEAPYQSKPLDQLAEEFRLSTSLLDDFYFYRMTESNVHRDDYIPRGAPALYTYMLGGPRGSRWDAHLKLAVMWPSGGGPEVARVILEADDSSLSAVCYSFDDRTRDLVMRLCRIRDGRYRVALFEDPRGDGMPGDMVWSEERVLRRFGTVTMPVPPKTPLVIKVELLEPVERPQTLPDLVIDPWDANADAMVVRAVVHNLGDAPADNIRVRLMNGTNVVQDMVIDRLDAPTDFVAKRHEVVFTDIPKSTALRVVVDPEDDILEILEENNEAGVRGKPSWP